MSKVNRYYHCPEYGFLEIEEDGDYVKYDDYKRLENAIVNADVIEIAKIRKELAMQELTDISDDIGLERG